ncbi:MAG: Asp-tRNA(Asn)/Glu-tRNA(Gln) amidotransferase subunit GatC [Dethiobacteria bacterium]
MAVEIKAIENAIRVIKIEIDPVGQKRLHGELNRFLDWLESLEAVDTAGVEPIRFGHNVVNSLRDDQAAAGDLKEVRKAAPNFDDGFYMVPPIIE